MMKHFKCTTLKNEPSDLKIKKKGGEGINLDFLKVCKQQVKRESVKKNPTHADAEVTYYETFCVQTWM